jgi:hypothetical protein
VTTSVDHEWAHDARTNRSAEKHRKNQGKLGVSKRVFLRGRRRRAKTGKRSGTRGRAWSEKIFHECRVLVCGSGTNF